MAQDCTTTLEPGQQSETLSQTNKQKRGLLLLSSENYHVKTSTHEWITSQGRMDEEKNSGVFTVEVL